MESLEAKAKVISQLLSEQLEKGNHLEVTVVSNSMSPLIQANDKVIVEKFLPQKLFAGDIILFTFRQTFCTHRYILKRRKNNIVEYITKGDRFFRFDRPISEDKIIGKITTIIKNSTQVDLSTITYKLRRLIIVLSSTIKWYFYLTLKWLFIKFSNSEKFDRLFIMEHSQHEN